MSPSSANSRRAPRAPRTWRRAGRAAFGPGRIAGVRSTMFASLVLAVVIGTLALGIVLAQRESRSHVLASLALRGTSSATFVSAFLHQQADSERQTATHFLTARHVPSARFQIAVDAFGSRAAVLLDANGRVLDVVPSDPALIGRSVAPRYPHLLAAERGRTTISNVVASAVTKAPVAAVAVPFSTAFGRRVFSAAYAVSGSTLGAFVDHTISYRQHQVFLLDAAGKLIAASPRTAAAGLGQADPQLARALARSSLGSVPGASVPSTFTVARVPGTPWRVAIEVPDSRLYQSIRGWTAVIPWIVLALVSVLGVALVLVLGRLTVLSRAMSDSARTDALTGLFNRRAVGEHLTRAAAHARRRGEPMAVIMIDLDRFKQTNDLHGHAAGDRVLCAVADCMRRALRSEDVCGRWGGDEFIVVMPDADEHDARTVAARLQASAREARLADIGLADGVQLSVGVASAALTSAEEIVQAADVALYRQKAERAHEREGALST